MNKTTLEFLSELKQNNYREWFADNKQRYENAKTDVLQLSKIMINNINKFDKSLGFIDPKKTIFRINRDIRFSKNKEPYKTNMGVVFNIGGNKHSQTSCYYIHIEPENCFLSAGIYMPDTAILKTLRTHIDENWNELQVILANKKFKTIFGDLSREDKILKKTPIGFDTDSPAIEYLKLTNFYVIHKVSDKIVCDEEFPSLAAKVLEVAEPFNRFLNNCLLKS